MTGPVADRGLHHTFAVIDLASLDEKDLPAEYPISGHPRRAFFWTVARTKCPAAGLASLVLRQTPAPQPDCEASTGLRRSSGGAQRSSRRNTISKSAATMGDTPKGATTSLFGWQATL